MTEQRNGKTTALITGAHTGIDRPAAIELARQGWRLVLACRSREETMPVVASIQTATDNTAIELLSLDLADLAAVRRAAQTFLAQDLPLHVLLNNAGLAGHKGMTKDGFEITFGTNHLGHFLFTTMLLDRIKESAPARIVN